MYAVKLDPDSAHVIVEGDVVVCGGGNLSREVQLLTMQARIEVRYDGNLVASTAVSIVIDEDRSRFKADLTIADPQLWYPYGSGDQALYDVAIQLVQQETVIDESRFRSGIKTVKLIQELDEDGSSFLFEVNGRRMFCKGTNWVPADSR